MTIPQTLILFSGLPGSGKTTLARMLARRLHIPLLARDRLQAVLRSQHLAKRSTGYGYPLMLDLADEQLSLGMSVILDAVFTQPNYRTAARHLAARYLIPFKPVYCYYSDETVWQARMAYRRQYVPHWTPVGWDDVQRIRNDFEPWNPHEAMFVDALNSPEQNLAQILDWLQPAPAEFS